MATIPYTDGYATVSGLRLHYVDYGGQGETLIALPGLIQSARAFDSIAPFLVPHVHLIALDFRGRGQSEWGPAEQYRIDQYLKDLRGFVDAMGLPRMALIGTSLGGLVARLYATAHPDRVTRLVLNDFAIGGNLAGMQQVLARPSHAPAEFAHIEEAVDWFLADRPGLARLDKETQKTWVTHYLAPGETGGWRLQCDPAIISMARSLAHQLAALQRPAVESELAWEHARRLTMPVLFIRGALSEVIASETVSRLTQVLPQARCVDIPGVSHSPTLYEEEAQAALLEFFGNHPQASPVCGAA